MSYERRRYRVVGGVLEKAWHGRDDDGWVKTKAEALNGRGGVDWDRPWMSVKADLAAMGFDGRTKAEAVEWARREGVSVPE